MHSFHRRVLSTAMPLVFVLFACAKKEDNNSVSKNAPKTAIVKDCAASPQSMFCRLIAAWNEDQPPAQRKEKFASLVSGKVPTEMNNPIAQCLALFRAYDKAAATIALHDCLAGVKPDLTNAGELSGGDLDGALGLNGSVRPTGPATGGAQACGGGHINPWLAQTSKEWNYGNWPHSNAPPPDDFDHWDENKLDREYQRLERDASDKWGRYAKALEAEIEVDYKKSKGQATQQQLDAAKAETKRALDEANQAIEKRNLYRKALTEGNDAVSPNENGTAYARTVEGFENPCDEFNNFLKGCAASGWRNGACKEFLDKLNNCQSTLILVDPDQGTACAKPTTTISKDTFDDIMTKICWSKIRPVGPDENPCAPSSVQGATVVALQPNPCTDPRVRIDPESGECMGKDADPQKVVDALLNRPKLAEVYAVMEKLCACALPPIGGTRDPGVGPNPRPTYQAVAWSAESAYRPFP